jgi:hypothetical protein
MKYFLLFLVGLFTSASSYAQKYFDANPVKYTGSVGSNPIEVTITATQMGYSGTYFYTKIRQTIQLSSELDTVGDNYTKFTEQVNGNITGYFFLKDFNNETATTIYGTWKSPDGKRSYPVVLYRN